MSSLLNRPVSYSRSHLIPLMHRWILGSYHLSQPAYSQAVVLLPGKVSFLCDTVFFPFAAKAQGSRPTEAQMPPTG